jgi:hypothetical protein
MTMTPEAETNEEYLDEDDRLAAREAVLRDAAGMVIERSTHGIVDLPGEFDGTAPFGD